MEKRNYIKKANKVIPSENQLNFTDTEFIAFLHYGMNTFCNTEHGTGREPEKYFAPANLHAEQWIRIIKSAKMNGVILTCKCSDGFCLWPSKLTEHSVKNSPWLDGNGDLVREVANACRVEGIKFGISISTYDMHDESYGTDDYNDFFVGQLKELCSNYGELFAIWLERDNNGKHNHDWDRYYQIIRELQPNAVIGNCGTDIRWAGNSKGVVRSSEWSVQPKELTGNASREALVQPDLGSRKRIKKADELVWSPVVYDLTMRPGWFFHDTDNADIKILSKAMETYFKTVGNNATFMLNVAPSHSGLIEKADLEQFVIMGAQLELEFKNDLSENGKFTANNSSDDLHSEKFINSEKSYFRTADNSRKTEIVLDMGEVKSINKIVIGENIRTGQQIEKFKLYYFYNKRWHKLYKGTTIGRKKICLVPEMDARRIKLVIEKTREFATIKTFKVY